MEVRRKPFQGVYNIIRFNWHFYILFVLMVPVLLLLINLFFSLKTSILVISLLSLPVIVSLIVSHWVYDRSGMYDLNWLKVLDISENDVIININAGFDETSHLLSRKFPGIRLEVFDFYDPETHTEPSIKRARKAYPPFKGSRSISTSLIPMNDATADIVILILSAHEIRKPEERMVFFKEVSRILKLDGSLVVVEHLRDIPNFLAYTIGFFHFFSRRSWMNVFESSYFTLYNEIKITPFISTFILKKNGTAS